MSTARLKDLLLSLHFNDDDDDFKFWRNSFLRICFLNFLNQNHKLHAMNFGLTRRKIMEPTESSSPANVIIAPSTAIIAAELSVRDHNNVYIADKKKSAAAGNDHVQDVPQWPVRSFAEPKPKELYLDPSLYRKPNSLSLRYIPLRAQDHIGFLGSGKVACAIGKVKIFGYQLRAQPTSLTKLVSQSTTSHYNSSKDFNGKSGSQSYVDVSHRVWHKFHSYSHESLLCISASDSREKSNYITPADVQLLFTDDNADENMQVSEKPGDFADIRDSVVQLIEKNTDICALLLVLPLCMPSDVPVSLGTTLEYAMKGLNFPLAWASNQIGCVPNKVPRWGRDFVQITSRLCLLNFNANSYLRKLTPFLDNDDPLWKAVELAVDGAEKVARGLADASADTNAGPCLLRMGGKDAGKSTVVRYCVNSWLSKCCSDDSNKRSLPNDEELNSDNALSATAYTHLLPQVLDVDIGQSEFQVSGHVVLCDVTEPVWGSPSCRLTKPRAQVYLGVPSPTNPYPLADEYRSGIKRLVQEHGDRSRPLVVNTMGWVQSVGHVFIENVIDVVKPHVIIDLGDYSEELRQQVYTAEQIKTRPDFTRIHRMQRNYTGLRPWCRMPNPVRRELALMARLCEVFDNRPTMTGRMTTIAAPDLLLMPPMKLPLNKFAFHCVGADVAPSLLLRALNVSTVAICQLSQADFVAQTRTLDQEQDLVKFDERNPLWLERLPINVTYFGLGIIVGVDGPGRQLYLLTAVPQQVVECDADVMIRGAIDLPRALADNFEQYRRIGRPVPPRPVVSRVDSRNGSSQQQAIQRQLQRSPTIRMNQTSREVQFSPERRKKPGSEISSVAPSYDNQKGAPDAFELFNGTHNGSDEKVRPYFVPRTVQQQPLDSSSTPQPMLRANKI